MGYYDPPEQPQLTTAQLRRSDIEYWYDDGFEPLVYDATKAGEKDAGKAAINVAYEAFCWISGTKTRALLNRADAFDPESIVELFMSGKDLDGSDSFKVLVADRLAEMMGVER